MKSNFTLYSFYKHYHNDTLLTYKGPFDKYTLSALGSYIRSLFAHHPPLMRKVFNIFIELGQNVGKYSAERTQGKAGKDTGIGIIQIIDHGKHYCIYTANLLMNYHVKKMEERCHLINNLSREQLREYKRQQRSHGDSSSANIGMIQVALISCNVLEYEFTPANREQTFFTLGITLDKEELPSLPF